MNCAEVQQLLSAYFDDELSEEVRCNLGKHLDACGACAHELAGFQNLSAMTARLDTPKPPVGGWHQLERELYEQPAEPRSVAFRGTQSVWYRLQQVGNLPHIRLALATSAIFLIVVGWFGYKTWLGHTEHQGFNAEFERYLDEFHRSPGAAQEFLLAKYEGRSVAAEDAVQLVGYRPAVADGMPDGYSVESTYLMKMPCCKCVQCLCKSSDGRTIAIFEHDDEETKQWFGNRPEVSASCNGTQCSLVELKNSIAASWRRGRRHITVIGIQDVAELTQLVAWFDERKRIRPQ